MQVHTDEAGTSQYEPIAVVASVIINPDKQFLDLERRVREAIAETIPEEIRDGYVFHAKDIFHKHRKRFGWSLDHCNKVVEQWLTIINQVGLPVAIGWWTKEMTEGRATQMENGIAHMGAFANSVSAADRHIRERHPDNVASLIVEDVGNMKRRLGAVFKGVREGEAAKHGFHTDSITNIKSGPFYAAKMDAPLLQLADACAYTFKRYVNRKNDGARLWNVLMGKRPLRIGKDPTVQADGYVILRDWS